MNFFANGNPVLNDMVRQLLISAYTRLNERDLFAEILDVHLRDRRKTMVSRLDLHGQITFGESSILMRGPAFDKSAVGEVVQDEKTVIPGAEPEPLAIEALKKQPKWEGTKIVKTSKKTFGTFGSGGRRDALKAAEAKKARILAAKQAQAGNSDAKKASRWGDKAGGGNDW